MWGGVMTGGMEGLAFRLVKVSNIRHLCIIKVPGCNLYVPG